MIGEEYYENLKKAYLERGLKDEWESFEAVKCGADEEDINRLKALYPYIPDALISLLEKADGTHWRKYGNTEIALYFFGSDLQEYPYYLKSAEQIAEDKNMAYECYREYIDREYDDVEVDERITDNSEKVNWLHFSDCMNNGGTSQLFIDFSPSPKGKMGQIVRSLHDSDEIAVIADSFEEYLKMLMENGYDFICNEG